MNSKENDGGLHTSFHKYLQKSSVFLGVTSGLTHMINVFT